jgi:UDPglucose 6-dehydrogenase
MRNISVIGTGYVGLVTGVALSEVGHHVTCIDIDPNKVEKLKAGFSPIYEPGLDKLLVKNRDLGRLHFTTDHQEGFKDSDVIYIAVGTPEKEDGSANLSFIEQAAKDIAHYIQKDVIVVTKSTVPVGTNDFILDVLKQNVKSNININVVSNPEFLREGSAIYDAFNGDRIVIGSNDEKSAEIMEEINRPFGIPIFKTDIKSAEMIKYASNAFLATKISFINEISNICEKLNANIEDVSIGMGMDQRIGMQFLNAGIGYGGSCFPKDTKALVQIAENANHDFQLLKSVIDVNEKQQLHLIKSALDRFGSLYKKRIALLGLAFKPNTDDMREAPSIAISKYLVQEGAEVIAYDPIAENNAKKILPQELTYVDSKEEALKDADCVFILTEWEDIRSMDPSIFGTLMNDAIVFDGRNCFTLNEVRNANIEYYSIGRPSILSKLKQ